jgi:hypothetical protein
LFEKAFRNFRAAVIFSMYMCLSNRFPTQLAR